MASNNTLATMNDIYKGQKIDRVNKSYHKPDVLVKYKVTYKGVTVYFTTQKDAMKFVDAI